jgi:cytoskeletal protein RodZ
MAISELGAFLQRHREEEGLGLDEVEARTRIRRKYVEAIEAGDWASLPPGVYTRGLLRNYARAIGASPASVLRMYVKERPSEARLPEPQLISQPLLQQPRFNIEMLMAIGLLIVAVSLFAWMVGTQLLPAVQLAGKTTPGPAAATGPVSLGATPLATASRPRPTPIVTRGGIVVPLATATGGTPAVPVATTTGGGAAVPVATAAGGGAAVPAGTSPGGLTPSPTAALELKVEATSDAWLMVRSDNSSTWTFMGLLKKGESRRWTAKDRFRVRTGNAGGTLITLNGRTVDPLGPANAVVEREWRLLPDGNIEQSG